VRAHPAACCPGQRASPWSCTTSSAGAAHAPSVLRRGPPSYNAKIETGRECEGTANVDRAEGRKGGRALRVRGAGVADAWSGVGGQVVGNGSHSRRDSPVSPSRAPSPSARLPGRWFGTRRIPTTPVAVMHFATTRVRLCGAACGWVSVGRAAKSSEHVTVIRYTAMIAHSYVFVCFRML
jgi:hypothetical protein